MLTCTKCLNNYSSKQRLNNHSCVNIEKKILSKDQLLSVIDVITKMAKQYDLNYCLIDNQTTVNNVNNINNSNNNNITTINNIYNNVYNIHLYNLNENIDVKSLIKREFFEEYYSETMPHFRNIQSSLNEKKHLLANPSKSSFLDKSTIKDIERRIKLNSERAVSHLSDKLASLFLSLLFSEQNPQYHMIYVSDENDINNFFIHIDNYWTRSNIQYLENSYIYHIFKLFIKSYKDYDFNSSSQFTEMIYDNFTEQINNNMSVRFYNSAYTHRHIVMTTFEKTKNIRTPSPFTYSTKNIKDTLDLPVNNKPSATISKNQEKFDINQYKKFNNAFQQAKESNNETELEEIESPWNKKYIISEEPEIEETSESINSTPKTRKTLNVGHVDYEDTADVTQEEIDGKEYIIYGNDIYECPVDFGDMGIEDLNKVGVKLDENNYKWF
jgi:hypothetical protein